MKGQWEVVYYSYDLDKRVKKLDFVPYRLTKRDAMRVGDTYWSALFGQCYCVQSLNDTTKIKYAMVRLEDGRFINLQKSLDICRDFRIAPFESKDFRINSGNSITWAELKALCCAGKIGDSVINFLKENYFTDGRQPADTTYYFLNSKTNYFGEEKFFLERDLVKSPRI